MNKLFYSAVVLLALAAALVATDPIYDEVGSILDTFKPDMHFIDQLYEKVVETGVDMDKIEEFEARPILSKAIASYIEDISGGGAKKLVLEEAKDSSKAEVYKTDMDRKVYVHWYLWSVHGLCKRLVETANDLVMQLQALERFVNEEAKGLIAKTKVCRAIVNHELLNDSFELASSEFEKSDDIILLP